MEKNISIALIKYLVKNGTKSIAQNELEEILSRDIHDSSLGCKITNTHVRIGKVHLDTFYEAQLLFGNAYWTDIFSFYFYNFIISKIKEDKNFSKEKPIILYGYETYSVLTLNKTISFLEKDGYSAHLRIYEVKNRRIRYCEEELRNIKEADSLILEKDPYVFFLIGISSTLSTFKYMNDALCSINIKYNNVQKQCTSIIQVIGKNDENDASKKFISIHQDELGAYVKCVASEGYLDFIKDDNSKKSYFYVSVKSTWYIPEVCQLCMPSNKLEEYPLIEVNESSVVPTQMIRLNRIERSEEIEDPVIKFADSITEKFLKDFINARYIHYGHIERGSYHFQYYFRLSRLYYDKKNDIEVWLKKIKENYNFIMDKTMNIIVAPQHYSNTGFINSVNNIIFDGTAHIMEFDIHKEYRSNFKAKYNNYSELEKIISDLKGYTINFYYVNDQIISGSTYYRTKSLIKSLFSQSEQRFHIFSGIFVLLNRNSFDTRTNFINVSFLEKNNVRKKYLPYFSYLNIIVPSLRSYDDSCPICFNKNKFLEIINECSLDSSVFHWQKKIISYRIKSIADVRQENINFETSKQIFIKLQCENDLWKSINRAYNKISEDIQLIDVDKQAIYKRNVIINEFFDCISVRILNVTDIEKIEYLIAYIKIMSRALLYYQEDVKKACFYILLKIFDFFICDSIDLPQYENLHFMEQFPIGDNHIILDLNKKELYTLRYDLYCVTISRLCSIGSCVLLNNKRLDKCRTLGHLLLNNIQHYDKRKELFDAFLLNCIKKLLCYDKGNSKAIVLQQMLNYDLNKMYDDEFYLKLFLENLRNPFITRDRETLQCLKDLKKIDITEKYKKLISILKNECSKKFEENIEIRIFTNFENLNNNIDYITKGQINPPPIVKDFIYDKSNSVFYISIGNNFENLKKISDNQGFEKILEKEFKMIKDATIIIGIKTKRVENVLQILKYRKEIMEMVQADFNNDAIPKLIRAREHTQMLSEIKTVTHKNKPLQEFENVFVDMFNVGVSFELQRKFLSLYMDTIISIAYREYLRFNKFKFSTLKKENSMFKLGYNILNNHLDYAKKQFKELYKNDIHFLIEKTINNKYELNDQEKQFRFIQDIKGKMAIIRFRDSDEICECYMIIKTLIDNAKKHCVNPEIWLKLVEDIDGDFDLYVENTINTHIHSPSDNGITLCALKYIFNNGEDTGTFNCSHDKELNKYKIIIKKFLINKEEFNK